MPDDVDPGLAEDEAVEEEAAVYAPGEIVDWRTDPLNPSSPNEPPGGYVGIDGMNDEQRAAFEQQQSERENQRQGELGQGDQQLEDVS